VRTPDNVQRLAATRTGNACPIGIIAFHSVDEDTKNAKAILWDFKDCREILDKSMSNRHELEVQASTCMARMEWHNLCETGVSQLKNILKLQTDLCLRLLANYYRQGVRDRTHEAELG
jgi:hypothetical protein